MMKIIKRDDTTFELTFKDSDNAVVNITGGTVFFTVKKNLADADSDAVISKSITSFTDPEDGIAILQITANESNIPTGIYFYDIQLKLSGKITSSERGKFIVSQDVTIRTS